MTPGDLVVCVNTGIIEGAVNTDLDRLREGGVYTIEDIRGSLSRSGSFGIRIGEVPLCGNEWWHSARFRPCRKTDISGLVEIAKERELEGV
jgi:hypothetical protein